MFIEKNKQFITIVKIILKKLNLKINICKHTLYMIINIKKKKNKNKK